MALSTAQSAGFSVFNSAVSAWSSYNAAKHQADMADINWRHNKDMAQENLKINQYITGRNKVRLLDATAAESISIQVKEMQAKASAEVVQASYGLQGGSAQQVLHDISRGAEVAQSNRLAELDDALFTNKLQAFQSESQAQSVTGLQPISATSSAVSIEAFAADTAETFGTLFKE